MLDSKSKLLQKFLSYFRENDLDSLLLVFDQIRSMTGYGEIRIEIRNNTIYRISVTQSIKPHVDFSSTDV